MARIRGTEHPDTLLGGDGADTIDGLEGNDSLVGGAGRDVLIGRGGDDTLDGGDDADQFIVGGDSGSDVFLGGEGVDTIVMAQRWQVSVLILDTAASVETLRTNAFSFGGTDADDRFDLSGLQQIQYRSAISLRDGHDSFIGTASRDEVSGGDGDDTLSGGDGEDALDGGKGDDLLEGGAGDDILRIGGDAGIDRLRGGEGVDTLSFNGEVRVSRLTINAAASIETLDMQSWGLFGTAAGDRIDISGVIAIRNKTPFELLGGADRFVGSAIAENVVAGSGDDIVLAGAGDDTIEGGEGDDLLNGGDGDDTFAVSDEAGSDTIRGGAGYDVIDAVIGWTSSRITLDEKASIEAVFFGSQILRGTASNDRLDFSGVARGVDLDSVELGDGADAFIGGGFDASVNGGSGDDSLIGSVSGDYLLGDEGDDTIDGGAGRDEITGGLGDDVLRGGDGADVFIVEGAIGDDSFDGGAGRDLLFVRDGAIGENLDLDAAASIEMIDGFSELINFDGGFRGTESSNVFDVSGVKEIRRATFSLRDGDDTFIGSAGRDIVSGDGGSDLIRGFGGNDLLSDREGRDRLFGGLGDDTYVVDSLAKITERADQGVDRVAIDSDASLNDVANVEWLIALGSAHRLSGTAGADTLQGGFASDDRLVGGRGADAFIFFLSGHDVVEDFDPSGADRDILYVSSGAFDGSFKNFRNYCEEERGGVTITFTEYDSVFLEDVNIDELSVSNFGKIRSASQFTVDFDTFYFIGI